MNRHAFAIAALSVLWSLPAPAILDTNGNGISDLFEMQYNNGTLPDPAWEAAADYDADGWTNEVEAAAGTDPFNANAPGGFLRPEIVHVPAVWIDTDSDEIPDTLDTPEAITITWPTIAGKRYTLLYSPDLVDWLTVPNETFIGDGNSAGYGIAVSENEKLFWRVKVEDINTDGDELTDSEEHVLGTDPGNSDSDEDGLSDLAEILAGTDPNNPDSDNDGLTDGQESALGTDANSADVVGPVNIGFNETPTEKYLTFRDDSPADLYYQSSVSGWQADTGEYIEIWDEGDGNPYVELQAGSGAHGVKQEFNMLPGSRVNFILRYKGRYEYDYDNAFILKVEGASELLVNGTPTGVTGGVRSHSFMADDESEKYNDWQYASVSITASPGGTGLTTVTLSLTPEVTTWYGEDGEYEIIHAMTFSPMTCTPSSI